MMRSPMIVWRRMNSHSPASRRPGLAQDRVRDGDLADVVQLGGVTDLGDLAGREPEHARRRLGELGHRAEVHADLRVALDERAQQHVAALAAG